MVMFEQRSQKWLVTFAVYFEASIPIYDLFLDWNRVLFAFSVSFHNFLRRVGTFGEPKYLFAIE